MFSSRPMARFAADAEEVGIYFQVGGRKGGAVASQATARQHRAVAPSEHIVVRKLLLLAWGDLPDLLVRKVTHVALHQRVHAEYRDEGHPNFAGPQHIV